MVLLLYVPRHIPFTGDSSQGSCHLYKRCPIIDGAPLLEVKVPLLSMHKHDSDGLDGHTHALPSVQMSPYKRSLPTGVGPKTASKWRFDLPLGLRQQHLSELTTLSCQKSDQN